MDAEPDFLLPGVLVTVMPKHSGAGLIGDCGHSCRTTAMQLGVGEQKLATSLWLRISNSFKKTERNIRGKERVHLD